MAGVEFKIYKTLSERFQGRARTESNTNEALLGSLKLKEVGIHCKVEFEIKGLIMF